MVKNRQAVSTTLGLLLGGLALVLSFAATPVAADERDPAAELYTVLSPTGKPPPIERKAMAERSASLDGKTVYLVDVTFNGGDLLLLEMQKWFAANLPGIKTEYRVKRGAYNTDDPELWAEIKATGGVMVMAIGH